MHDPAIRLSSGQRFRRAAARPDLMRVWLPAVCLLTLLICAMSVLLARSQADARNGLEERYALRATLAGSFVAAYLGDFQAREIAHATEFLSARHVTEAHFKIVSSSLGFKAALLLDAQGRALNVLPGKPALIGTRLTAKYAHLRSAVAGNAAISNVVPSAVRSLPIVEIAVPFDTPNGRRVFSGGAPISESPLAAFLADALPFAGARSYLIDANGAVVAAGGARTAALTAPPSVHGAGGDVDVAGRQYRFASIAVPRTPWRLVTLAPSDSLYAPLSGRGRWLPWLVLLAFALVAVAALGLLSKLMGHKAELTHLASHDPLTGALNRRTLERVFARLSTAASRSQSKVGVMAIDLDNFKAVNDLHGHAAGDALLRRVADLLALAVRPADIVARLGGDEFVVLLANVTQAQAEEVGERVLRGLDTSLPDLGCHDVRANCCVGIALASADDAMSTVLARADGALYEAKATGGNRLRFAAAGRPARVAPAI